MAEQPKPLGLDTDGGTFLESNVARAASRVISEDSEPPDAVERIAKRVARGLGWCALFGLAWVYGFQLGWW